MYVPQAMGKSKITSARRQGAGKLATGFVTIVLTGLAVALAFVATPQSMQDVEGYGNEVADSSRNLQRVMEESIKGGYAVTLSEAEINGYLKRTLEAKQTGFLSSWVKINAVAVRLNPEVVELITEREVFGHRVTTSMDIALKVEEFPDGSIQSHVAWDGGELIPGMPGIRKGGRFGRLAVPQGFLLLTMDAHKALARVYQPELKSFDEMARFQVKDGSITLDPKLPQPSLLPGAF